MKVLEEAASLKSFLSLLIPKKEDNVSVVGLAERTAQKILKSQGLKYHLKSKKKTQEGYSFRLSFKKGDTKYLLKCFVVLDSGYFTASLWDDEEENMFEILASGPLKTRDRAVVLLGQERLGSWMEKNDD